MNVSILLLYSRAKYIEQSHTTVLAKSGVDVENNLTGSQFWIVRRRQHVNRAMQSTKDAKPGWTI